jgi:transmembrane sensor
MDKPFNDDTILARWLSGELSEEDKTALQGEDMAAYERIIKTAERMKPPPYDAQAELDRFQSATLKGRQKTSPATIIKTLHPRPRLKRWLPYAAAAAITILLAGWMIWPKTIAPEHFVAEAGSRTEALLADGSTSQLNAGSTLSFSSSPTLREANLNGEAFFDVQKNEVPFQVTTASGTVTVLGTSFNVYDRDGIMEVSCRSGKVRVIFEGTPKGYDLLPGQSVLKEPGATVLRGDNNKVAPFDWTRGTSFFDKRPMAEVLAALERQYGLTIENEDGVNTSEKVKLSFPNDNLDQALRNVMTHLRGAAYEKQGKRLILRKKD